MIAQRVVGVVGEERVAVAKLETVNVAVKRGVLFAHDHLSGLDAGDFVGKRGVISKLGEAEVASGEIYKSKTVRAFLSGVDRSEEVVPFRIEHLQIRNRAR